jgi:predicted dehydrogenase
MMRACLCGVSGYGEVHFNGLMREHQAGRCELVAATVINRQDEADKCARLAEIGCAIYEDYHTMLDALAADPPDVCFLPVGIGLHVPFAIAALEAGMNVYIEKPLTATIQQARELADVRHRTGKFVAVGYQTFYQCDTWEMKRAILAGRIGSVRTIKCQGRSTRPRSYYDRNGWAGRLRCGDDWILDSPFNNAMAHQLMQCLFLAGAELNAAATPTSIQAELYHANEIESADTAALRITTAEGPDVLFLTTHAPEQNLAQDIHVLGDQGRIHWELHRSSTLHLADGRSESLPAELYERYYDNVFLSLRELVAGGQPRWCSDAQAAVHTLCVNGAHEGSAVLPIPAGQIRQEPAGDSTVQIIDGLDEMFDRCFAEEKLPAELGAPWARPAEPFDLTGYTAFTGPKGAGQ